MHVLVLLRKSPTDKHGLARTYTDVQGEAFGRNQDERAASGSRVSGFGKREEGDNAKCKVQNEKAPGTVRTWERTFCQENLREKTRS